MTPTSNSTQLEVLNTITSYLTDKIFAEWIASNIINQWLFIQAPLPTKDQIKIVSNLIYNELVGNKAGNNNLK